MSRRLLAAGVALATLAAPARGLAEENGAAERAQTRENRLRMIEERLAADEKAASARKESLSWLRRFSLSGYVQPQFVWQSFNEAGSPNVTNGRLPEGIGANSVIARADGSTTNTDFFRLRRARLKAAYMPTDYARLVVELDANLSGGSNPGSGNIARQVEAIGIAHWDTETETEFGLGIFKVPIGFEVLQSHVDRPFVERSWGTLNMFPSDFDTGARAYTTFFEKKLAFQLAVVNGAMLGEKSFTLLPDMNRTKDFVGRFNYNLGPFDFGAAGYYGRGQLVDGTALRYKQYPRYAGELEVAIHKTFLPELGGTRLFAEVVIAQNMDRGLRYSFALPSMPANVNDKVRDHDELSYFIRVEQDITEWVTLAARFDSYTPDSAQKDDTRDTYAVAGVVHFTKGLQLNTEFDYAFDDVHPAGSTRANKEIATLSTVLQARF